MLIEKAGADLYIKNKFGATIMHIAAQQDQPLSLYYLFKRGMDIDIRDSKGSTPRGHRCIGHASLGPSWR
jgi:ankyrin repeat protein